MTNQITDSATLKRIRLGIFSFYFTQGICFSSWASRIPDIKSTLGLDDAAWGTILLMIPIGQICGMSLSGLLVSKLGSKRILTAAMIGYAITLIVIGLSQSEYALLMSLIVFGFFGNFCNISVNTQGVSIENLYHRPIMASFHGGWSLAGLVGASIGLLMSSLKISPSIHFSIVAIIVFIGLLLNVKYLQNDIKKETNPAEKENRKKNKPESFLFLLGLVAFCGMAAEGAMADWSGIYMVDIVGLAENLAPIGLTAYMITMATGRFVIDKASVRWGQKRIVQCSGLCIFLGLTLAVAYPHPIATIVAFMIIGLGTSSIVPTIYSIAGQKTKIQVGMALTIVSSISFLGFLMGPPLIGYISHATNLRVSYALIGLFGICIMIFTAKLKIFKN